MEFILGLACGLFFLFMYHLILCDYDKFQNRLLVKHELRIEQLRRSLGNTK